MNFDFTERERGICDRIKGVFREQNISPLAALETGDLGEIRRVTLECQHDLAEIGYLSLGGDKIKH